MTYPAAEDWSFLRDKRSWPTPVPLRIAVVSLGVPPSPYGQSRVLGHLLEDETSDTCILLSENPPTLDVAAGDRPYGAYQRLATGRSALQTSGMIACFGAVNEHGGLALTVWRRAREIARAARAFRADVIIGCTASPADVPAAALAAVMTRTPFLAYLFDDPVYQWVPGRLRRFAAFSEPFWSRAAAAVIAPNEFMARDFANRTGRQAVLIRNPVADAAFRRSGPRLAPRTHRAVSVVYTGTIYHAQADAFVNLLQAIERLDGRVILDIYTNQSEAQVAAHGVSGGHVRVFPFIGQEGAYAVQRRAGILFLPLAFRSSNIRKHDAGTVVDAPDPERLAAALDQIIARPEEVAHKVENALRLAEIYRASTARELFRALLRETTSRKRLQ